MARYTPYNNRKSRNKLWIYIVSAAIFLFIIFAVIYGYNPFSDENENQQETADIATDNKCHDMPYPHLVRGERIRIRLIERN